MTRPPSDPLELDAWTARRRVVEDARAEALTAREWLRAYGVVWLGPLYALAIVVLLLLMGAAADLEAAAVLGFAAMVATAVGFVHVFWRFSEWRFGRHEDRRTQTVLRRAVAAGRSSWAVADGELVRIYALAPSRRPWPPDRGKIDVAGALELHAVEHAAQAHEYVLEVESAARPTAAAVALARVVNERGRR